MDRGASMWGPVGRQQEDNRDNRIATRFPNEILLAHPPTCCPPSVRTGLSVLPPCSTCKFLAAGSPARARRARQRHRQRRTRQRRLARRHARRRGLHIGAARSSAKVSWHQHGAGSHASEPRAPRGVRGTRPARLHACTSTRRSVSATTGSRHAPFNACEAPNSGRRRLRRRRR